MGNALLWGGPVQASDLNGVDWGAAGQPTIIVFNHGPDGGIGSSSFAALAAAMQGSDGRILPNLLASAGYTRDQFDKFAIGGFSAFHGLASALTGSDADLIDAVFLIDACFSAVDPATWTKSGYVSYGAMAARGQKVMTYTASAGGGPSGPYPSSTGSQCMLANVQAAASAAGMGLSSYTPPDPMPPGDGYRAGNLIGVDYGPQYASGFMHGDMINRWGTATMDAFAVPFFNGQFGGGALVKFLAGAAGVGIGLWGARQILK